jgi:predicted metalloprotease
MRLDDERESSNVEDRRGTGSPRGSGISMGTAMMLWPLIKPLLRTKFGWMLIGLGVVAYMVGFNPLALIGGGGMTSSAPVNKAKEDKQVVFMKKVLASTEDVWKEIFAKHGARYKEPKLVIYRGYTHSGCGGAQAQMGPFYCPADKKIYLDLSFFDELARKLNAPGDFAQAYVLAHEIGHYVQDLQGILSKVQKAKQSWGGSSAKSNALQVKVELQADCYAGVWGYYAKNRFNILEPGDIDEALNAASSIGDDTLMKKAGRAIRPDAFTHGSSVQRVAWFKRGFETGDMRTCNTFK